MSNESLGEAIKRMRGDRSQKAISEAAGITQTFLSELETGRKLRLGADTLFKLAAALGVECSHFAPFFADGVSDAGSAIAPNMRFSNGPKIDPDKVYTVAELVRLYRTKRAYIIASIDSGDLRIFPEPGPRKSPQVSGLELMRWQAEKLAS